MSIPTTEAEIAAVFAGNAKFSLGCMFAQVVVDTFFAGIMTMQVYQYFKYQRKDSWWTKSCVISASIINLAITVYLWYFIQYLFVENFGKWSPFAKTQRLAPFPFLDALNSGICQAFFAYRAYRLCGRQIIIPVVLGALILTSIGATLTVWVMFASFDSLFQAGGVSVPELVWLSSIMSADIIITLCILYGLIRSKTGWSHTDKVITRLIRMTLESQIPPTIIAVTFMIEFVKEPASLFGSTLQGIQSKFYAMGLMYALNARLNFQSNWRSAADDPTHGGQEFALSNRPTQKTIQVDVEVNQQTFVQTVPERQVGINRAAYLEFDNDKANRDFESMSDVPVLDANQSQSRLTTEKT